MAYETCKRVHARHLFRDLFPERLEWCRGHSGAIRNCWGISLRRDSTTPSSFCTLQIIPLDTIIGTMIMSIISSDYLPYQLAAARLGLRPESLRRYIHAGKIEAESAGRTYYVHINEITRFREARKAPGRPKTKSEK